MLWDMHVHLDFMRNAPEIIRDAEALGMGLFAVTVTPQGFQRAAHRIPDGPNVRLCAGLHPWWAADGRCGTEDAEHAAALVRNTRYVGEIGLDASPKHVPEGSLEAQAAAFETICSSCAEASNPEYPHILSLHSVQAADLTLDILEKTGCLARCRCIFHWFTGSGTALTQAVKSGCYFSINEMMLNTRRGREYARQIPAERLLLETDLPPGEDVLFSAIEIAESLERTLEKINLIRGTDMFPVITRNNENLFGCR